MAQTCGGPWIVKYEKEKSFFHEALSDRVVNSGDETPSASVKLRMDRIGRNRLIVRGFPSFSHPFDVRDVS